MNSQSPFKWRHFHADIILLCVRWYLRYALSYRDLAEMMRERGLSIDHTTIYRWVQCYAPELEKRCRPHLKACNDSWKVDETYIKIKKTWTYLYRAVDSEGNVFVAGETTSPDFPTTPGAFDTTCGADGSCDTGSPLVGGMWDAYVTKLNATGSDLLYSTYFGGTRHNVSTPLGVAITGSDLALSIAIDSAGDAYVAGMTDSIDFPVTATAFQKAPGGGTDGFVTKLNPTGKALLFSTYLGGSDSDQLGLGEGIALDSIGDAYIAGITLSSDFPTTAGAFDTSFNGGGADAFVTKVDAAGGVLVNSTFLGGVKWEAATSIALDSSGDAFVTGLTDSADFPTTPGAFSTSFSSYGSVYVTEIKFGAVGPAPLNVPVIAYVAGGAAVAVAVVVALLWIRRYRTRSPPPPPVSP